MPEIRSYRDTPKRGETDAKWCAYEVVDGHVMRQTCGHETEAEARAALGEVSHYARKEPDGSFTLRQRRYARQLAMGREHNNDVCASAMSLGQLREMCAKHWPDADYSEAESR